jgi:CBS domain-containing protein
MLCEELMKREIECVLPHETVQAAARKMVEANIGFVPVCDESGKVLGTLTDRDVTTRLVAAARPATTPVEDIMTHEVVAIAPGADIQEAERLMGKNHKSRIMCVDEDGRIIGVISLSDIAQHEDDRRTAETLREVTEREAYTDW